MFRQQAQGEDQHRSGQQQRAHVGETARREEGIEIGAQPAQEKDQTHREKDFQRRVQRADFEDDQQEAHAILQGLEVTFPLASGGSDRDIGDRVASAEESHGDGGGVGEAVGQEVEEFAEFVGAHRPKAGGQVSDVVASYPTGDPVVETVGQVAAQRGLRVVIPCANGHVVTFIEFVQQPGDVGGVVLTVGVEENQHIASGVTSAGFDRRAIAHGVGVRQSLDAVLGAQRSGVIDGAIVDDQNFRAGTDLLQPG